MKRVIMLLLASSLLFAGCLEAIGMNEGEPSIGIDDEVIDGLANAMTGIEIEALLSDEAAVNITALAEAEEKFRVEIYSKEVENGELVEITFIVGKDEANQLAETGIKFQSGMMGLEYTIIQGAHTDVNSRVGNQWFLSRDEVPEYVDPFLELADDSSEEEAAEGENPDDGGEDMFGDLEPDFGDLDFNFTGLNWTVTIDQLSMQQVATTSNGTHSIMVEFLEAPPRLHEIQIDSNDGNEAMSLTVVWGDEASLAVDNSYLRTSVDLMLEEQIEFGEIDGEFTCDNNDTVPWDYVNDNWDDCGDNSDEGVNESLIPQSTTTFIGEIDEQVHEVLTGDIEMRIGQDESDDSGEEIFNYSISMNLADGTSNLTGEDGAWWNITWSDSNGDGFVSTGDTYTVTTNSSYAGNSVEVRFYDNWSESYEGGPLPGFELFLLLGAFVLAAFRRNFS